MKLAAAEAIANVVPEDSVSEDYIIPSVFDERVAPAVAEAVAEAARKTGSARRSGDESGEREEFGMASPKP
jgi:malate dehydrogenase (oxaloacetate-decarboxylating)